MLLSPSENNNNSTTHDQAAASGQNILDEMLARQTNFLQDNFKDGLNLNDPNIKAFQELTTTTTATSSSSNNNNVNNNNVFDDDDDDDEEQQDNDIIFIKEQPILPSSPSNYTASNKKFKKQRTISLPQLPLSKLIYDNSQLSLIQPRTQNYDELLHLTGSSAKTLSGNKTIQLNVVHSTSPFSNNLKSPEISLYYTSSASSASSSPYSPSSSISNNNKNDNYIDTSSSTTTTTTTTATNKKQINSKIAKTKPLKKNIISSSIKKLTATTSHPSPPKKPRLGAKKQQQQLQQNNFQTDKDGHYIYQENDIFGSHGRFISKELLGQGTFGKVLKCIDTEKPATHPYVAIKIIRAVDRYREAAKTELRVLQEIMQNDPQGQYQCLLLNEAFDFKNHICLVTDLYGKSLYDFMCNNGIARFPGSHIQAIARQLIRSICYLHDLGIIHTDLKPENVLLVDETYVQRDLSPTIKASLSKRRREASGGKRKILRNPEIKIIDFGSAVFYNEYHPPVISTRHYRAPEIVLGLGWSFPCDVWSIACVLVELIIGESLYPIHENLEHMAMMQRINGELFPTTIIDKMFYKVSHKLGNLPVDLNTTVVKHFDKSTLSLIWPEVDNRGNVITKEKSIKRVMESCDRLDVFISKFLKLDYGEAININWNLSPEQNWELINSKNLLSSWSNGNGNPSTNKLTKETFLFWYWFIDLLRKMFEFDPTKRITAREALDHEWFNLGILDEGISLFADRI